MNRPLGGLRGGHHAAGGLHHENRGAQAALRQGALQGGEIGADHRRDERIDRRGAGALVLADLGEDTGGQRDGDVRRQLAQKLAEARFVAGVAVGVQQDDRDGLHARVHQPGDGAAGAGLVEWPDDLPLHVEALVHFHPQRPRHQGWRWLPAEVVEAGHPQAPDFEHVAEAGGRDEAGAGALAFENSVRGNGGSVDNITQGRGGRSQLGEQ